MRKTRCLQGIAALASRVLGPSLVGSRANSRRSRLGSTDDLGGVGQRSTRQEGGVWVIAETTTCHKSPESLSPTIGAYVVTESSDSDLQRVGCGGYGMVD